VIDPRRQQQNDQIAAELLRFQDELGDRMRDGDVRAWELVDEIHRSAKRRGVLSPFLRTVEEIFPSPAALEAAELLTAQSVEALREPLLSRAVAFTVNGKAYATGRPLGWLGGHNLLNVIAPLTWHACLPLLIALGDLAILINDPSRGQPLSIERARYASQQTELIRVEHSLWELAAEHGGPTDRVPYAYRLVLLAMAWRPIAHQASGGAWTLCVRCGALLHRSRSFSSLPRCGACMKETAKQREWPAHAIAPHSHGTWLLGCQYPGCESVFEGPRHRRRCDEHTSSKLSPKRRQAASKVDEKHGPGALEAW
jgi:hypothetical protein